MRDKFFDFLQSPSRDTYLAVREAVIASDHYDPYSRELNHAQGLLDAGDYSRARERISAAMPDLLLSPKAHLLLSVIGEKTNDHESAKFERVIASKCIEGILGTGDDSRAQPYLVLRISDEYDVVNYLGKQLVDRSLIADGGRRFDLLRCDDGSELWFEITAAYHSLEEAFNADVYRVRLSQVGPSRLKVMALIREVWGLPPASAKSLLDSPQPVLGTIRAWQRRDVQRRFTQAGAIVEFESPSSP